MTWQRISLITFIACVSLLPFWVFGAEGEGYVRLTGLPNSDINDLSTEGFINALYLIAISIAAFLAVGRLIFAGVKIMLSGANVTSKEDAKRDIQGALLGLLIVLAAVLILTTINPELTNFNFLRNAPEISKTLKPPPPKLSGEGIYRNPKDAARAVNDCAGSGGTITPLDDGRYQVRCPDVNERETPTSVQRFADTLDEAINKAEECGGTYSSTMTQNGKFRYLCPKTTE